MIIIKFNVYDRSKEKHMKMVHCQGPLTKQHRSQGYPLKVGPTHLQGKSPGNEVANKEITNNVCVRLNARVDRASPDISVTLNSPALILFIHGWKQIVRE